MKLFDVNDGVKLNDILEIDASMLVLFTRAVLYCKEYNLPCVITSIKGDRDNIKSSSKTHSEGRAIDMSVKGWTDQHVHRFCFIINRDYSDIAAISSTDNVPRAAIFHDSGYGPHIHLQVKPNANIGRFIKE